MRILLVEKNTEHGCLKTLQNSPLVGSLRICHYAEEAREANLQTILQQLE